MSGLGAWQEVVNILPDNVQIEDRDLWVALVRLRANYLCERCEKSFVKGRGGHAAHHKDGNNKNNILSNGELLCSSCHRKHHLDPVSLTEFQRKGQEAARIVNSRPKSLETRRRMTEAARKKYAALSAEERSNIIKRGWETRRKRAKT